MSADAMLRPKAKWMRRSPSTSAPPQITDRDVIEAVIEHAHVLGRGPASEYNGERGTWLLIWLDDRAMDWVASRTADEDDDGGVDPHEDDDRSDAEPSLGSVNMGNAKIPAYDTQELWADGCLPGWD